MRNREATPPESEKIRLDKWLWAARFFKTRRLAIDAVTGGKVHLNGKRTKPSHEIHVGDRLVIRRDQFEYEITVSGLSRQRRPALEAALLYQESEESKSKRQTLAIQLREKREQHGPGPKGRPTKRERRQLIHLLGKD